jgi:hypothetical protein
VNGTMSDTSSYTEQQIVVSAWINEHPQTEDNEPGILMICNNNLAKKLLQNKHFCVRSINSSEQATLKVKPRTGRPSVRGSQCQLFEESVAISPQKLIPK